MEKKDKITSTFLGEDTFNEGVEARSVGQSLTDNPYTTELNRSDWMRGWRDMDTTIASSHKKKLIWIKTSEQKPNEGQRCLIWHESLDKPVFAYYEFACYFGYAYSGGISRVSSFYWMPDEFIERPRVENVYT